MSWLRRAIVRAVPTCTLWRPALWRDAFEFVLWPRLKIAAQEVLNEGG